MLFVVKLFLANVHLWLECAYLILLLLQVLSQLFFPPDSLNVLRLVDDRGGWSDPLGNRVNLGLESVLTVDLLLLELLR